MINNSRKLWRVQPCCSGCKKRKYLGRFHLGLKIFTEVMSADIKEEICQHAGFNNILILRSKSYWTDIEWITFKNGQFIFTKQVWLIEYNNKRLPWSVFGIAWLWAFLEKKKETHAMPGQSHAMQKGAIFTWDAAKGLWDNVMWPLQLTFTCASPTFDETKLKKPEEMAHAILP